MVLQKILSPISLLILLCLALIAYVAAAGVADEAPPNPHPNQGTPTHTFHRPEEMIPLFHPHLGRSQ